MIKRLWYNSHMTPEQTPQQQPQPQNAPPPQVVYVSRPVEPIKPSLSPEATQKHEEAKKKYPHLNLSNGEYIISSVRRHPIGLFQIWAFVGGTILLLIFLLSFLLASPSQSVDSLSQASGNSLSLLSIPVFLVIVLLLIGGYVGTYVYRENTFYLTNESVIQNVQASLFSKRLQTVSLGNVEDASYTQNGILPHIFNYGMIRLSTQGDETTYRFNYASQPERQIALLNNAVESFKNGRPFEDK